MKGLANVGDVLAGKYRVEKILGIGGMGMVVAAKHLQLDQPVALKFMLPSALESPEASARFLREARAAGKLTSEHVCRVTDVGRFESGAPYIVMEYLEGYDLGTMLKRRGPLRAGPAIDYILQACEGLAEAHALGIIHRDLKPDNLYLSSRADGGHIIKVLDFGISKAAVTGIATRTGDILGSPAYMAPEQMKATKDVDARADVWSLGIVLYQLLTGRLPFTGDTLPTLCMSVLNDDPVPPIEIRQDLPEGLSDAILRCLAKEREDRYPDIGEFAESLATYASPDGLGSVTRVRSALRGRQAPPDPSETIPHGFATPTLQSTGDELYLPRLAPTLAPVKDPPVEVTTMGASSGESLAMSPRRRLPLGLVGGLGAAIGLVILLIVMVVRRGGGDDAASHLAPPARSAETGLPPASGSAGQSAASTSSGPSGSAAPKPIVEPIIEPIVESTGEQATPPGASTGEQTTPPGAQPGSESKGTRSTRNTRPPRTGQGQGTKPGRRDSSGAGSGSSTAKPPGDTKPPSDTEEDKWGRMLHDQPKGKEP